MNDAEPTERATEWERELLAGLRRTGSLRAAYHRLYWWVREARMQVRLAGQRVVRGWDDRAVWSLDVYLARTLGEQLVAMADATMGMPYDYAGLADTDEAFQRWRQDLQRHGQALLCYARTQFALDEDPAALAASTSDAQQALRWVAESLPSMWT